MRSIGLWSNELEMLKDMLERDIESTGWSEIDYSDPELMQFYADRANLLVRIKGEIK
jgi:hypothetical protein